jgi:hypothetical protein
VEELILTRRKELLESSQKGEEINAIEQALKVLNQLREVGQPPV